MKNGKTFLKSISIFILIIVVIGLLNVICDGKLLTSSNINGVLQHAIVPILIAWAYCFIFSLNYMDLSLFSIVIVSAYAGGLLGNQIGIIGVLLGSAAAAILMVFLNFAIFAFTGIPPWVAGLGMCMIYEAIAAGYSSAMAKKGQTVVQLADEYRTLGSAPWVYILLVIAFVIAFLAYNRSSTGLNARAMGENVTVAETMGIDTRKTVIMTGVFCGIFVGMASVVQISIVGKIQPQTGLTSLTNMFQPLAAVLLAEAIQESKLKVNMIISIPVCGVLIYLCFNIMTMFGVPSGTFQQVALGLLVIVFGIIANKGQKGIVK